MSEPQVDESKVLKELKGQVTETFVDASKSSAENSSGRKIYRARRVGTSVLDSFAAAPTLGAAPKQTHQDDQIRQDESTGPTAKNNSLKRRADVHR
jgi:hypothetical protein